MNELALALKVASEQPHRYRIARPAKSGDETILGEQVVLSIEPGIGQRVFSVRAGLYGTLQTDHHGVTVFNGRLP